MPLTLPSSWFDDYHNSETMLVNWIYAQVGTLPTMIALSFRIGLSAKYVMHCSKGLNLIVT